MKVCQGGGNFFLKKQNWSKAPPHRWNSWFLCVCVFFLLMMRLSTAAGWILARINFSDPSNLPETQCFGGFFFGCLRLFLSTVVSSQSADPNTELQITYWSQSQRQKKKKKGLKKQAENKWLVYKPEKTLPGMMCNIWWCLQVIAFRQPLRPTDLLTWHYLPLC